MSDRVDLLARAYYRSRLLEPHAAATIKLRDLLVKKHVNLARSVAHSKLVKSPEPYEDLEQLALKGLVKAVERYNPFTGAAFSSFAVPYIRGEIGHFERDQFGNRSKVPRSWVELYQKVLRIQRKLVARHEVMSELAIARGLGVDAERWGEIEAAIRQQSALNYDDLINEPSRQQSLASEWAAAQKAAQSLKEPHRTCIVQKFWGNRSVEEIADVNGLDAAEVEQFIIESLELLREKMEMVCV